MTVSVELVVDARAALGEGPVWDESSGILWWIDILQRQLHAFTPADGLDEVITVETEPGAVVKRVTGGLVLATSKGFEAFDPVNGRRELIARVEAEDPATRMNDGKCDSRGRFYAGTMDRALTPGRGSLYRLDVDGTVSILLEGVTIPNGLAWSNDGRMLYWIDSPTQSVHAFDVDLETGDLSSRRPLFSVAQPGLPDGMCSDAEGFLWIAMYGGGAVRRYSPDGRLDFEVGLPVTQITSCAFGGPTLHDLYITTAADGLDQSSREKEQTAGGLFRCRPGVSGTPAAAFGPRNQRDEGAQP